MIMAEVPEVSSITDVTCRSYCVSFLRNGFTDAGHLEAFLRPAFDLSNPLTAGHDLAVEIPQAVDMMSPCIFGDYDVDGIHPGDPCRASFGLGCKSDVHPDPDRR